MIGLILLVAGKMNILCYHCSSRLNMDITQLFEKNWGRFESMHQALFIKSKEMMEVRKLTNSNDAMEENCVN